MATEELVPFILSGDLEKVTSLFEEKRDIIDLNSDDVEYADASGNEQKLDKPIIVAAMLTGNADMVKKLVAEGANVK